MERTSNHLVMPRCDDCNSDAIDLSANPVPFGEYFHLVAHVSILINNIIIINATVCTFVLVVA